MNPRSHAPLRFAAVGAASVVVGVLAAMPANAAGGASTPDVHVVNTETVQVYTSPSGEVHTRRVYEQLALTGHGSVNLSNPVSTANLRNLDGFGGFTVEHGDQITRTSVDGDKQLRSVSDYNGKLPLDVSVAYKLNGRNVKPGDVVGRDGHLEVTYTVQNVTAEPRELTFDDGHGGTVTKTVQVPIPMVGSLTTTAPPSFTNVESASANMGGDGKGGTQLSFTMTLFPPIGSDTAVFGYSADIKDGVVPRAEVSALPVNPMESPTFKSAAGSYQGGADTGAKLADGAGQIDANLLKLRDGAAQLLAGLIKLRDGAGRLETGLAGQAVPGSAKLADGAHRLDTGLGRINAGAGDLSTGLSRLSKGGHALSEGFNSSTGGEDFVTGSKTLADGLALISGGLDQLADAQQGVPAAAAGATALRDGVDRIRAGVSNPGCDRTNPTDPGNPCGLLEGLQSLQKGLESTDPAHPGAVLGATQIEGGLAGLADNGTGLPAAKGGVDAVNTKIAEALASSGSVKQLAGALTQAKGYCAAITDPVTQGQCIGTLDAIIAHVDSADPSDSIDSLREQLTAANGGLGQVSAGLAQAIGGVTALHAGATQLRAGLQTAAGGVDLLIGGVGRLQAGLSNPLCDPKNPQDPKNPCGLREGLTALVTGLTAAVTGLDQLAPGGQDALAGATRLSHKLAFAGDGAAKLADGLGTADAGANRLAAGTGDAKDGSGQLAGGADQLSSGLKDAADGSGRLSAGLREAAGGAPKLVKGSQRLSDEGTKQLVKAGTETAQNYGELYATMAAGAQRADAESMAFGAPKGAVGLTAYNYVIEGDDGEGGRNWARGVGGLAILGAGAAAFAFRRRLV